jgi:hypothetical protein
MGGGIAKLLGAIARFGQHRAIRPHDHGADRHLAARGRGARSRQGARHRRSLVGMEHGAL